MSETPQTLAAMPVASLVRRPDEPSAFFDSNLVVVLVKTFLVPKIESFFVVVVVDDPENPFQKGQFLCAKIRYLG